MENRPIILDHRMQRPEYSSTETITFFFFFFPFPFPPLLFPYPPKEGQNSGVIVALPEVSIGAPRILFSGGLLQTKNTLPSYT